MRKGSEIWVFGDHRNHPQDRLTLQVLGRGRALSGDRGRVTVMLLGHHVESIARDYVAHGGQRILQMDHPELASYRADLFTALLTDLIREHEPDVFLVGASDFGKELAPRVAKRLGVGLSAECIALDWDEEKGLLVGSSAAFGGNFLARIAWNAHRPFMATVSAGTFPERPYDGTAGGEIIKVERDLKKIPPGFRVISSVREPHQTTRLEDARIVIAGGRGLRSQEGFNYIRELAMVLGGEVGATRPAVDGHWTSHDQLIGQTGKAVRPELLVTCGTSGAVQYTAGIRGAGTVVAVNRDPRAPIFKFADFGIVADALSFLPAFITEAKGHLFRAITESYRTQVKTGRDPKAVTFGQRVRKLREDHKMSVTDLAEKIGHPPEAIEEVESDRVIPPVSFLLQLSQALQIDPSNFLSEQEKTQVEGKRQEGYMKRTQDYSYRTLTPGAADKHLRAFMVTIEPKEDHKMIEYKHPGEEFIFVYRGELEITLGGKVFHLKEGETIHFDSETRHKLRNTSDEKCELIVTLYTP
jgi:electron transfer flavoprotein alpha subunit